MRRRSPARPATCVLLLPLLLAGVRIATAQPYLTDHFGRVVDSAGIRILDWEGQIANPAAELFLSPPAGAVFPVVATLTGDNSRLYFDDPCTVGPAGPGKLIEFFDESPQSFRLAIFPDRDTANETHQLTIEFVDDVGTITTVQIPILVRDEDRNIPNAFNVTADFSQDQSTFYGDAARRAILQQAADDWAYFFADMALDVVPIGDEQTFIWSWPLAWTGPPPQGNWTPNAGAYTGFLLYAYGVDTPEMRAGGAPSNCCFQSSGGSPLDLRRSGTVEIDIKGNFNTLGWFLTANDDDWHVSANLGDEPNDMYSIVHHEIGHALAFNSLYPRFANGEANEFSTPAILDYWGSSIPVNAAVDHFDGIVDPASLIGIFGNDYFGFVPRRRWLPTKLDLLLFEAVGYTLRETSPFIPFSIPSFSLPDGQVGVPYSASIPARGGIAIYDWTIETGSLPPGLALDRFTGAISGTPTSGGTFNFDVRVRDSEFGDLIAGAGITIIPGCLLGDVNEDGLINGLDIQGFVRVKETGTGSAWELCAANLSYAAFIDALLQPH